MFNFIEDLNDSKYRRIILILIPIIILFVYMIFRFSLEKVMGVNEVEVLPIAKHFMNPSWIANDWYLNHNKAYCLLFNLIAGPLTSIFSLGITSLIGRILVYALFAVTLSLFLHHFNIHPLFGIIAVIIFLNRQSIGAREWIIGGFETKPIAYALLILALVSLIRRKYGLMFFFSGLAFSFHVLVGFLGFFCLMFAMAINFIEIKESGFYFFRHSYLFLISGAFGIYAVFQYVYTKLAVDTLLAATIYVEYRVPHHTFPAVFPRTFYSRAIWAIIALILVTTFDKRKERKTLAMYGLGSAMLIGIGLLTYAMGRYHLLKYYWFRNGDTMLRLIPLVLLSGYIGDILHYRGKMCDKNRFLSYAAITLKYMVFIYASLWIFMKFVGATRSFIQDIKKISSSDLSITYSSIPCDQVDVFQFIRENIPQDACVLAPPTMNHFYIGCERSTVVLIKHIPQSDPYLIEWFNRLTDLNGGKYLMAKHNRKALAKEISDGMSKLNKSELISISKKYNCAYYLAPQLWKVPLKSIYKGPHYAIYDFSLSYHAP